MKSLLPFIPLGALVLLLTGYGVNRIRSVGGEGDGFLLAGAGLVLVGVFTTLTILGRERKDDRDDQSRDKDKDDKD